MPKIISWLRSKIKLQKSDGTVINPRQEDGHGSTLLIPSWVALGQQLDSENSATRTAADGATQFVGAWKVTREAGFVRQLTVLVSNVSSGLGGTFVFEYGEDGSAATISESREIEDFATVRDFDLLNAGAYYRVKFTPSRVLVGSEFVVITTTQRRSLDGAFVRLANQEIEEANAALPQTFAYLKAFNESTGKSVNIRPTSSGDLRVGYEGEIDPIHLIPPPGIVLPSGLNSLIGLWVEAKNFGGITISTKTSGGVIEGHVDWSDDDTPDTGIPAYPGPKAINHTVNSGLFTGGAAFSLPREGKYYRIRADTISGTPTFAVTVIKHYNQAQPFLFPVSGTVNPSWQAILTKTVSTGAQPDGDFVNAKADGIATETVSALGVSGVYQSDWVDTDGWTAVEVFVAADQVSASEGILIEFSDDIQAGTPTVRGTIRRTFTATDAARGFMFFTIGVQLDGFRIGYTNGGVAQSIFYFSSTLRVAVTESPKMPLESDISSTQVTVIGKHAIFAKNATGVYGNILRGPGGGLQVSVKEHEAETPIKSLTGGKMTRTSVASTAVEVTSSSPLVGRRSISIKAISSGSAIVYIGFNSAVTSANGWPLSNDQSIDFEFDDTVLIWAIASGGTQAVSVVEAKV